MVRWLVGFLVFCPSLAFAWPPPSFGADFSRIPTSPRSRGTPPTATRVPFSVDSLTGEQKEEARTRARFMQSHDVHLDAALVRYLNSLGVPTELQGTVPMPDSRGSLRYKVLFRDILEWARHARSTEAARVLDAIILEFGARDTIPYASDIPETAAFVSEGEKKYPVIVEERGYSTGRMTMLAVRRMTPEEHESLMRAARHASGNVMYPTREDMKFLEDLARKTKAHGPDAAFHSIFPHDQRFYYAYQGNHGVSTSETAEYFVTLLEKAKAEGNRDLTEALEMTLAGLVFFNERNAGSIYRMLKEEWAARPAQGPPAPEPEPLAMWWRGYADLDEPAVPEPAIQEPPPVSEEPLPPPLAELEDLEFVEPLWDLPPAPPPSPAVVEDPYLPGDDPFYDLPVEQPPPPVVADEPAELFFTDPDESLFAEQAPPPREVPAPDPPPAPARPAPAPIVREAMGPPAPVVTVPPAPPADPEPARPAVATPPTPVTADPATADAREAYLARVARLAAVERELKGKYVGIDHIIDSLMSIARNLELTPELVLKPSIVSLMGLPGEAKTSLIQDWVRLMGWDNRFLHYRIRENTPYLLTDGLQRFGRDRTTMTLEPGASGVVFYDDIHNLMTTAQFELAARDNARLVTERTLHHDRLWQITGNGTMSVNLTADVHGLLRTIEDKASEIGSNLTAQRRAGEEISRLEGEAQLARVPVDPAAIARLRELITSLTTANQKLEDQIRATFEVLKREHRTVLGRYATMSGASFTDELKHKPEEVLGYLGEQGRTVSLDKQLDFRQVVIVLAGNPETVVDPAAELADRTLRDSGAPISPDRLHDFVAHGQPGALAAFVRSRFGEQSGWISRLQVNHWQVMAPPDRRGWELRVAHQLQTIARANSDKWSRLGVPTQLEFDASVQELFMRIVQTDPMSASRFLYGDSMLIFGSLFPELDSVLLTAGASARGRLRVTYDARSESFVVVGERGERILVKQANLNLPILAEARRRGPNYDLHRQLFHQAGHAVLGTLVYGSLPRSLTRNAAGTDIAQPSLWEHPNVDLYEADANRILIHLGGYAAEELFAPPARTSSPAQQDHRQALAMMEQLMGSLREKQGRESFGDRRNPVPFREIVPPSLRSHPLFSILASTNGDQALALKEAYALVKEALRRHGDFVNALHDALVEREMLTQQEIRGLFLAARSFPGPQARLIATAEPGIFAATNCRVALEKLGQPGLNPARIFHSLVRWWYLRDLWREQAKTAVD